MNADGNTALTARRYAPPMSNHAEAVRAAIESLQGTLQVAAALVRSGRAVDLAGLDQDAARLCAAIVLLPDTQAAALRPAMEALVRDLDRTTAALVPPDG